jgi:alpha-L-rhamnosidase
VNLTDSVAHKIALYFLDWDSTSRAQTVEVLDASTNQVLDTRSISGFNNGKYLVWNVKGNVRIRITRTSGANAVVSGLFFDVASGGFSTKRIIPIDEKVN